MDKAHALVLLKLLAALESWSFSEKHKLPEYIQDDLTEAVEKLSNIILKE